MSSRSRVSFEGLVATGRRPSRKSRRVAVGVQIQSGCEPYDVVERPDAARGGGRGDLDLRCVDLVHRRLSAEVLFHERDERIGTFDTLAAGFRRVADEVIGEEPAPTLPVLGVEVSAVARLELLDRFDLLECGRFVHA